MAVGNLGELLSSLFVGTGGKLMTPEELAASRAALAKRSGATDTSPVGHWTAGAARLLDAVGDRMERKRLDEASAGLVKEEQSALQSIASALGFGGDAAAGQAATASQPYVAPAQDVTAQAGATGQPTYNQAGSLPSFARAGATPEALRTGIIEAAKAVGADPVDLATAISFETGGTFNPTQKGPTTKWGTHRGLIQFGEPQAREYGVDWNNPLGSQLGANGAIANYLRSSGFKPGMSGMDLYSTINAGAPGRYNASDTAAGGTRGDVRDKWETQMGGHRANAMRLIGELPQGGQATAAAQSVAPGARAGVMASIRAAAQADRDAGQLGPSVQQMQQQEAQPQVAPPAQMQPQQVPPPLQAPPQQMQAMPAGFNEQTMGWLSGKPQAQAQAAAIQPQAMQQPQPAAQTMAQQPNGIASLLAMSANPRLSDNTRSIARALVTQKMGVVQKEAEKAKTRAERLQIAPMLGINPAFVNSDEAWKFSVENSVKTTTAAPGSSLVRGGQVVGSVPHAPMSVAPNTTVLDPNTNQPVFTAPSAPTTEQLNDQYAQQNPGFRDRQAQARFNEASQGSQIKFFEGAQTAGAAAKSSLAQINELDRLLAESPAGAAASMVSMAGRMGIELGSNASSVQAANAIINRLVPAQREPGSGPMSDRDIEMFRASLPQLVNTREGNQKIIATMRAIAQYDEQRGVIANRVFNGELTPTQGREAMMALRNPLEGIGRRDNNSPPSVGQVVNGYRFKGGNPSDKKNWVRQ